MPANIGRIFYMNWELEFLHHLQTIHTPELDKKMLFSPVWVIKPYLSHYFYLLLSLFQKPENMASKWQLP